MPRVSTTTGNEDRAPARRPPIDAGRLLDVVRRLALELHPRRRRIATLGLDGGLDREFGFDSLARAELLLRIERTFRVRLPDTLFATAETPRDLLTAVERSVGAGGDTGVTIRRPTVAVLESEPIGATTLTDVLDWHVLRHPERPHILLTADGGEPHTITYAALSRAARTVATGLWETGVLPGDRVAIMLPTGAAFFQAFYGALYAGAVPVPIYPPVRLTQIEDHLRRQTAILKNAGAVVLITTAEAAPVARLLKPHVMDLKAIETVEGLSADRSGAAPSALPADRPALIQYTSGSTGDPKGVVLSHANLLANIRAMGEAMDASSADVMVSWLPLYHDMGLIGAWLGSLYFAAPVAVMPPFAFLARPERWLWTIHQFRGTVSAAPNFAFELCLARIDDHDIAGLDLSSLRMVANGAEPVRPETVRRFTRRFAKYGFKPGAMAPMYGLAENSVALALPPPGRVPIIDRVRREDLARRGEARPAPSAEPNAIEFVASGQPLSGHQIRLVDDTGHEVGERRVGRLQFKGPSATTAYFRNPDKTRALFDGDWLDSGDLAYIANGDVFITGRIKDIILRAGRNIYPEEVEEAVGNIDGIRKGCVALFGTMDPSLRTERIVLVAETRESGENERARLRSAAEDAALGFLDLPPDEIFLARPGTVPKTSSGKLRRAACRELYEKGLLEGPRRAVSRQLVRLTLAAVLPQLRRTAQTVFSHLYARYWRCVYALLAVVTAPLVILLPRRAWRWGVLHAMARLALRLMGIPLSVSGLDSLPKGGAVIVANHSSFLDSLVLAAVLPGELGFVAKRELAAGPVSGPFLRRLGTVFVERMAPGAALEGAESALNVAQRGERLVFYPEGTFTRMPGLLAFHLGGFMVASRAGIPVVPLAIRGTRYILRGDERFARRGKVSVHIAPPLSPEGDDFDSAVRLRDAARAEILARVGEPDLAHEHVTPPAPA